MSLTRKILAGIGLVAVIPFLTAYYLFTNVFAPSLRNFIIFITTFIALLGLAIFISLARTLTKLYKNLNIIAKGEIDQKADVDKSSGLVDLAVSINQLSQRLRESADELEKRSILIKRSKREFQNSGGIESAHLSDFAHELRAPLINIDKSSAVLLERIIGVINTDQESCLKAINSNAKRLIRLINDLLEASKIESGKLPLKYNFFYVKDAVVEAVNAIDNWRINKHINLGIKIPEKTLKVYADRDRIVQVIVNLLSNAIKFTPANGEILIWAERFTLTNDASSSNRNQAYIKMLVQDTGIGIPESRKEEVFEKYNTGTNVSSNTIPNTGLGLHIAKQIIENHAGRIWVESQAGKGSRLAFIIPENPKALVVAGSLNKKPSKRILIIDDESEIRELLSRELGKKGYSVTVARDGLEGLKQISEHSYDLVITDVRMPNIAGVDCIKISKKIKPDLSFIIITGFSVEQELEEILKKEAYACFQKPFDLPDLLRTVEVAPAALVDGTRPRI